MHASNQSDRNICCCFSACWQLTCGPPRLSSLHVNPIFKLVAGVPTWWPWLLIVTPPCCTFTLSASSPSAGGHRDCVVLVLQSHALAGGHGGQPLRHEGEHADLQPGRHGLLLIPGLSRPGQASPAGESQCLLRMGYLNLACKQLPAGKELWHPQNHSGSQLPSQMSLPTGSV